MLLLLYFEPPVMTLLDDGLAMNKPVNMSMMAEINAHIRYILQNSFPVSKKETTSQGQPLFFPAAVINLAEK